MMIIGLMTAFLPRMAGGAIAENGTGKRSLLPNQSIAKTAGSANGGLTYAPVVTLASTGMKYR